MHPSFSLFGTPQPGLELAILSLRLSAGVQAYYTMPNSGFLDQCGGRKNFLILTVSVMDIDPLGKISVDLFHLCTCVCFSFSCC